jgi:hypothetical protein
MGKNKPQGKAKGKGSQLVIRIDKSEREAFVGLCEKLDTSAAREIRRFMRGFVADHANRQAGSGNASADAGVTIEELKADEELKAEQPIVEAEVLGSAPVLMQDLVSQTNLRRVAQPDAALPSVRRTGKGHGAAT